MGLVLGTNCGFVTVAPTSDPSGGFWYGIDTEAHAFKDTAPVGAIKVTEIGWWCENATQEANFEVGIYNHNSSDDEPEAVVGTLSQTNAKGTTAGWKKVTGLNIAITAETIYWIAVQLDDTTTGSIINASTSAGARLARLRVTTLPSPWGTSDSFYSNLIWSIYAVWEAEPSEGTNTQINIGDDWKEISAAQINIGDVWKEVAGIQVNIGDTWKEVF